MASERVQTHSRCPAPPWILQIVFCGRCPSARSWPGLRLPTPKSDRWRRVRRPAGQRRTWNTARPSEESRRAGLSEEEEIHVFKLFLSNKNMDFILKSNDYCTHWHPPLVSTCCSTRWAAERTASPAGRALGSTPPCRCRHGKHLLCASPCADSSQADRIRETQRVMRNTQKGLDLWPFHKTIFIYKLNEGNTRFWALLFLVQLITESIFTNRIIMCFV